MNRFALFDGCKFFCNSDVTTGTTQTDVVSGGVSGDQGGAMILNFSIQVGHTGWSNEVTGLKILGGTTNDTELTDYSTGVNPAA